MRVIDFRSDTVTRPTPEMRRAMFEAEVGDDVLGDDPTVKRLEAMAAEMLGKEAGLFVSSGTMGNLVAVMVHCQRGQEVIAGDKTHLFNAEAGGASVLGGVVYHPLANDRRGMLAPDAVDEAIRPDDGHYAPTRLVALENTHNFYGGAVLSPEDIKSVADVTSAHGIRLHIDGARLFNAAVYLETPAAELVKEADTVTFCLSKGLGAPVGSVLCGSHEDMESARRIRKMLGGAMRQVGVVAAAGVVALETMVSRLAEDHANARKLALGLARIPGIKIDPDSLPTNLVFFEVEVDSPAELSRRLDERGVKALPRVTRWRMVTHNDIDSEDVDYTLDVFETTVKELAVA